MQLALSKAPTFNRKALRFRQSSYFSFHFTVSGSFQLEREMEKMMVLRSLYRTACARSCRFSAAISHNNNHHHHHQLLRHFSSRSFLGLPRSSSPSISPNRPTSGTFPYSLHPPQSIATLFLFFFPVNLLAAKQITK